MHFSRLSAYLVEWSPPSSAGYRKDSALTLSCVHELLTLGLLLRVRFVKCQATDSERRPRTVNECGASLSRRRMQVKM